MIDMSTKLNCWEYTKCGLEEGGCNSAEFGVCPTSIPNPEEGTNCGLHAGRLCWTINDTLCKYKTDEGLASCLHCNFYLLVRSEEGYQFVLVNTKRKTKFSKKTIILDIGKTFTCSDVATLEKKFIRAVVDNRSIDVVLDFKNTEKIDKNALGLLLAFRQYLHKDNCEIPIINVSKPVRKIIKQANFDRLFKVEDEAENGN